MLLLLQGEELEPARAKAEQMGVKQIFIDDLREEFVRDYVFPMFRANSLYEGTYLLGTSIARSAARQADSQPHKCTATCMLLLQAVDACH
jgi:argininosuccinate synthase